jgi:isocitrate dehydrogenase
MADPVKPAETPKANVKIEATGEVVKKDKIDEPIHADAGKGSEVTAAEQKLIDAALGDEPEVGFLEVDEAKQQRESAEHIQARATQALIKFHRLNRVIPQTTPDEHFIWGIGEHRITVGDLRSLLKVLPPLEKVLGE